MDKYLQLPPQSRLDVFALAEGLTRAGRLSAKNLTRLRGHTATAVHPLVHLAELKLADLARPGEVLDMPQLLRFVSEQAEQPVV